MKKIFDMVAIFSGVIGLASIALNASTLTPENALVHSARAIIVLVFVLVPFLIARALEKMEIQTPTVRILPTRQHQVLEQTSPSTQTSLATQTTYFDYLFQAGTAREWDVSTVATMPQQRDAGENDLR